MLCGEGRRSEVNKGRARERDEKSEKKARENVDDAPSKRGQRPRPLQIDRQSREYTQSVGVEGEKKKEELLLWLEGEGGGEGRRRRRRIEEA